jgi:hypothetical protein
VDTDKKLFNPIAPNNNQAIGKCLICKEKNIPIVPYRIYKEIVFGSYKKTSTGHVCRKCKHEIKHTVRVMENEILQKFAPTYGQIWEHFILKKHFPQNVLDDFIEDQFKKIKIEPFCGQINPEVDECSEEERGIIGTCLCCKKEEVTLTRHHPLRKKVFGSNNEVVFLCRDCHNLIEKAVTRFEGIILRKFFRCYGEIWKEYTKNGFIDDAKARELARDSLIILMTNKGLITTVTEAREAAAAEAN